MSVAEKTSVNCKGHVTAIEPNWIVFDIRHDRTVRLDVLESVDRDRLRAAMESGECIEIFYEEYTGLTDGQLFLVC